MLQDFVPRGLPFLDAVILRNSRQSLVAEKAGSWQSISVTQSTSIYFSALCSIFFPVSFLRLSWTTLSRWCSNLIPEALQVEDHEAINSEFLGRCPPDWPKLVLVEWRWHFFQVIARILVRYRLVSHCKTRDNWVPCLGMNFMRRWRTVCDHVDGIYSCDAINVRGWSTSSDNSLSVNLHSIGECYMMNQVSSAMIATLGFIMSTVCPNGACSNYR